MTLLAFFHDEFGTARVQAVLTSTAKTFEEGLLESLGVDRDTLAKKLDAWLARQP